MLPLATGWPESYLRPEAAASPWADAVRRRLRRFLHERAVGPCLTRTRLCQSKPSLSRRIP
jgi:hypothetical protein